MYQQVKAAISIARYVDQEAHKRHNGGLQDCRNSEFLAQLNHEATPLAEGSFTPSKQEARRTAISVGKAMPFTYG